MTNAPRLDVSDLPETAWDSQAPIWWGNMLMLLIETTSVGLLLAAYFYLAKNFTQWPPPRSDAMPPIFNPNPELWAATANTILMLLACYPMYRTDRAARRLDTRNVRRGLMLMIVIAAASIALRVMEFRGLHFRWDDNAYGSIIWTILSMHLIYQALALGEFTLLTVWTLRHPLDDKHGRDVVLIGICWYWVAAIWLPIYGTIFWSPRFL